MDHMEAPVLEALARYHRRGALPFTPPGHKQGRGADPEVVKVLGDEVFRTDLLAFGGLDDRLGSGRVLERAEALMADAVRAGHTFFSTCGSSLSVKAAMLAVAGPHETLLVGRDAHKSVVSGLIISGVRPVWVEPEWDGARHIAHPPSAASFERTFDACPEARGALVTSPTPYGSCADLAGIAEVCHRRGRPLIVDEALGGEELLGAALRRAHAVREEIEAIGGLHVDGRADYVGPGLATDFDPFPVVIDLTGLGVSGYRAADWLRDHHDVNAHLADHRRISAQLTHADDTSTTGALLTALRDLADHVDELRPAPEVAVPAPGELRMAQSCLPRDAYFGSVADVPLARAAGRVAAEMITPYPPGIPAVLPGEVLKQPVLDYLRTGVKAGMNLPDAADPGLDTIRVLVEGTGAD
ncbi:ornithine decarboxylase [Streptomyces samsunensis]|uniref:aminotransferase class I/II-fold pyridoxal phosphate-dependent enzyme n=1 Tax=Streptomyces malaysiensis TaxID=92644 RepID=UPI0015834D29|nr:ornithine decarboxylase [Streptomyces samsunensis]NUH36063.1 ornithine decarboxylase [Streptomyces samsunensis]